MLAGLVYFGEPMSTIRARPRHLGGLFWFLEWHIQKFVYYTCYMGSCWLGTAGGLREIAGRFVILVYPYRLLGYIIKLL